MAVKMPMRDRLLDGILIPRTNGSDGLARVESFIANTLEARGAGVQRQPFTATPYGLQLAWTAALLLMIGSVTSILGGWHSAALVLALAAPMLLLMEFELLWSPVSGLLKRKENNVIGSPPAPWTAAANSWIPLSSVLTPNTCSPNTVSLIVQPGRLHHPASPAGLRRDRQSSLACEDIARRAKSHGVGVPPAHADVH